MALLLWALSTAQTNLIIGLRLDEDMVIQFAVMNHDEGYFKFSESELRCKSYEESK